MKKKIIGLTFAALSLAAAAPAMAQPYGYGYGYGYGDGGYARQGYDGMSPAERHDYWWNHRGRYEEDRGWRDNPREVRDYWYNHGGRRYDRGYWR
ncbi:hypothetical protein [Sphingomonas morindae]|uniref:Uncharacterized protein n=1 Tax=Sphingomonas morindae TaxID=1541170 RepID=A0ABY4X6D0_9SPHN|nr:hypothetical protein [Sphingomonas morindae]USI72472.1 hypothetical protein LHA26_14420 [Sphingomonas morindae]